MPLQITEFLPQIVDVKMGIMIMIQNVLLAIIIVKNVKENPQIVLNVKMDFTYGVMSVNPVSTLAKIVYLILVYPVKQLSIESQNLIVDVKKDIMIITQNVYNVTHYAKTAKITQIIVQNVMMVKF